MKIEIKSEEKGKKEEDAIREGAKKIRIIKVIPPAPINFGNRGITITFGEGAENHIGNQKIEIEKGKIREAFTFDELLNISTNLNESGIFCEFVNLRNCLHPMYYTKAPDAGVLIIRGVINKYSNGRKIWEEISSLNYDKKAFMYGKLKNKHARHNLCFADFSQEPKYEEKKGTIINFSSVPELEKVRKVLPKILGQKADNLLGEANDYYDLNTCGIGYHGDKERKIVVGLRLGASFPLCFKWKLGKECISQKLEFTFSHGDIYVLDGKASGNNCLLKTIPILKHSAGCKKYTN